MITWNDIVPGAMFTQCLFGIKYVHTVLYFNENYVVSLTNGSLTLFVQRTSTLKTLNEFFRKIA